jgi:hypothetical protein
MSSDTDAAAHVTGLFRYPVKGLSAEQLDTVDVAAGQCLPFDRAFAIENGGRAFDAATPQYMPKNKFLMLMNHERLAALQTRFDPQSQKLTIARDGKAIASGNLGDRIGRQLIEQFLSAYMSNELRGPPRIVHADGHSFSDTAEQVISLINLASVRELERVIAGPVDPMRFRANIYVDGIPPWSEFAWLGQVISADGKALFRGIERIGRCAATNVDPQTGARDLAIPRTLMQAFGHMDMGVYLEAISDGPLRAGASLAVMDD